MINLLISNILLFTNLAIFYSAIFKPKRNKSFLVSSCLFCIIICTLLNMYIEMSLKTIVIIILIIIYSSINYADKFLKKLIALFSFLVIYMISEVLSANILQMFTGFDATVNVDSLAFLTGVILSNLFVIILVYSSTKWFEFYSEKEIPVDSWIILILPISTIALLLNINDFSYLIKKNIMFSLILLGFILSNFVTIYIFFKVVNYLEYKNKIISIELEEKFLKSRYHLLQQQYDQSFSFLHDILKKSIHLNTLLTNKDYTELHNELNILTSKTFKEFNMLYTNSDVINNLINSKLGLLNKLNIEVKCTFEYNNFSFMKTMDQFALFSTLLDFSISSCEKSKDSKKIIILKSKHTGNIANIQFLYNKSNICKEDSYIILDNYLKKKSKEYNFIYSFDRTTFDSTDSIILLFTIQK